MLLLLWSLLLLLFSLLVLCLVHFCCGLSSILECPRSSFSPPGILCRRPQAHGGGCGPLLFGRPPRTCGQSKAPRRRRWPSAARAWHRAGGMRTHGCRTIGRAASRREPWLPIAAQSGGGAISIGDMQLGTNACIYTNTHIYMYVYIL